MRALDRSGWPEWCGSCHRETRLIEIDVGGGWERVMRCPACHPEGPYKPSWPVDPA